MPLLLAWPSPLPFTLSLEVMWVWISSQRRYCLWNPWMGLLERSCYPQPCHPIPSISTGYQKHFLDDLRFFQFSAVFYSFYMKSYASKDLFLLLLLSFWPVICINTLQVFYPRMNIFHGSRNLFILLPSHLVYNKIFIQRRIIMQEKVDIEIA